MIKGMTEMSIIITGLYLSLSAAMPILPASIRKREMDALRIIGLQQRMPQDVIQFLRQNEEMGQWPDMAALYCP